MTAICKTILIHGTNLQGILDYGSNPEKTSVLENGLEQAISYAGNPLKTLANFEDGHDELLVSGILCQPDTAVIDFGVTRETYLAKHKNERYATFDFLDKRSNEIYLVHKQPVTAIHVIQSFGETDLDPRMVHQMGIELCKKLGVQAVVDTHMNKVHLHNHIIINAYMPDGSTKFKLDKAKILEIRELSDEIQHAHGIEIKFAIPRQQLNHSLGNNSYREWSSKQQGISWKEEMRIDMADAKSVSDNKEDFITIMQDYGYEISKDNGNSIVWWNKTHSKKVRDMTLGEAYMLGNMFPENEPEVVVGQEPEHNRKHVKRISIARYDWNGRRRTDLEMILRKAIALLQLIGNRYQSKGYSSSHTTSKKLEMMEHAMETVINMGLENQEELEARMDETGSKLNHIKSQLRRMEGQKIYYDSIIPMITSYRTTKQIVDSIKYWPDGAMPDLMLSPSSTFETQKARAALSPMNGEQKRELFLALQRHLEYTITVEGFSGISSFDAEEIFAFFKGTAEEPPACLRKSVEVTMERVYQKRNDYLKQRFDQPIQNYQIKEVSALLSEHGIDMDVSTLTQYDAINIRNCYGKNPFSEAPISEDLQENLSKRLAEHNIALNRELQYVLPSEYEKVLNYLDGFSRTMPGLMKESAPITDTDRINLQNFMEAKGISASIPLSAMTKTDHDKMYGYVISQGYVPDCLKPKQIDRTEEFIHSIEKEGITEKKFMLILQLRNETNELLSLGIEPSQLDALSSEITYFQNNYEDLELQRAQLAGEYNSLVELRQQMTYAESPNFIYGSLYNEKIHEKPEVIEKPEPDQKNKKLHFDVEFDL